MKQNMKGRVIDTLHVMCYSINNRSLTFIIRTISCYYSVDTHISIYGTVGNYLIIQRNSHT